MSRVALVTGASRGIGRAIALALAEEGFDVVAAGLPDADAIASLATAISALGRRFASHDLDLADLDAHGPVLDAVWAEAGQVDCLVNNAGVSVRHRGDLLDV